jgi:hypothetical protein
MPAITIAAMTAEKNAFKMPVQRPPEAADRAEFVAI